MISKIKSTKRRKTNLIISLCVSQNDLILKLKDITLTLSACVN